MAIIRAVFNLKLSRAQFTLLISVANAANVLLVPLIANATIAGFTALVINAAIIYLTTEQQEIPLTYLVTGKQPNGDPYLGSTMITPPDTIDAALARLKALGFTELVATPS